MPGHHDGLRQLRRRRPWKTGWSNMKQLKLSDDMSLPIDAATQTFALIGRKGSGKTYAAGKLAELLIGASVQTVILDLVGKWWGLRLAADGRSAGIDIPMFGGLRGDIPLEATGGSLLADALVESGRSAILDISQFSKGDRQRFAFNFGERLWRLKKGEMNPVPVHLMIEESQLIVPENIPAGGKGEFLAQMYGMYEEIIRLGRNYGIGVTMITQRPQSVAKEVLNQAEPLLVFQLIGAHERTAVRNWIRHQGMDESLIDSLPSLKKGECWFWSPEWLQELRKIKIAEKWTFDSTATPKVGEQQTRARTIKPIDLKDLQTKMAATIERAKADDPKALKAELVKAKSDLQKALAAKPAAEVKTIEKPVVTDKQVKAIETVVTRLEKEGDRRIEAATVLRESGEQLKVTAKDFAAALRSAAAPVPALARTVSTPVRATITHKPVNRTPREEPRVEAGELKLDKCHLSILAVLSQYPDGCKAGRICLLAGYAYGGNIRNHLSGLRTAGLLSGGNTETMTITDAGMAYGPFEELPSGEKLIEFWLNYREFDKCHKSILQALLDHPDGLDAESICRHAGYEYGGNVRNHLSDLRTAGVLVGKNTETMQVNEDLLAALPV